MSTWIEDAPAFDECQHEPNLRGTACQHCGIPAEMVTPDELAEALTVEIDAARIAASGQMGWLDHAHADGYCALGAGPCQHERDCPHVSL